MRTSKLLTLGMALLGVTLSARAEEPGAPAPTVAEAEASAPAGETAAEATPEPDGVEAAVAEAAPPAVEEAAMPGSEEAAMPGSEQAAMPGSEQAAMAGSEEAVPAVADASRIQLGAIGYDGEGRPGRIHVVRAGDTLWFISDAYLGTPWVWPSIWQDNRDIANPHLIYPGDHIWITPSEMRKVTPEEAEALLAGEPAEGELTEPASLDLAEVVVPGPAERVTAEQPRIRLSNREAVGLVSAEEIDAAASILANTTPPLMISQADRIYIGLGAGEVAEGDQFSVLRVGSKVFDPETSRMLGYHVEFLGWVEVKEVDVDASLAVVMESASEMAKGDRLIPRRQPRSEIPLADPPDGVEGQISYLPNSRTEMGTLDFVYLNRGTQDGIQVGSPLQVYRKGYKTRDDLTGSRRQIPDRVVADLVVVRTEPEASVAFIRHTQEELARGDHFRGAR